MSDEVRQRYRVRETPVDVLSVSPLANEGLEAPVLLDVSARREGAYEQITLPSRNWCGARASTASSTS